MNSKPKQIHENWKWNRALRIGAVTLLSQLLYLLPLNGAEIESLGRAETKLRFTKSDNGFLINEGEDPVLFFQTAIKTREGRWPRSAYVHPLYDLDGQIITEDFPEDHGHHRGIFWAWHQVWVGDRKIGDAWECRDFTWEFKDVNTFQEKERLSIHAEVHWKSPDWLNESGMMVPIARERIRITVYPRKRDYRLIDFRIALLALEDDVRIGGSEDRKGYGGFSPRIKLTEDQVFTGRNGEVNPITTALTAGPWMDISSEEKGLSILQHPRNPGFPQPWILRRQRSMQNAVFPGRNPVPLSKQNETVLSYRMIIHNGSAAKADIDIRMKDYSASG